MRCFQFRVSCATADVFSSLNGCFLFNHVFIMSLCFFLSFDLTLLISGNKSDLSLSCSRKIRVPQKHISCICIVCIFLIPHKITNILTENKKIIVIEQKWIILVHNAFCAIVLLAKMVKNQTFVDSLAISRPNLKGTNVFS